MAFIITTGILTFVPLIVIGFVIYYIHRQVKARERTTTISENLPA
jgi:preprotein translocase subunit YajC